jgi:hypothetical protein
VIDPYFMGTPLNLKGFEVRAWQLVLSVQSGNCKHIAGAVGGTGGMLNLFSST